MTNEEIEKITKEYENQHGIKLSYNMQNPYLEVIGGVLHDKGREASKDDVVEWINAHLDDIGYEKINIVKLTCKELGITQKELASLMGVNDGTPAQWSSKGDIPEMAKRFMETLVEYKNTKDKLNRVTKALLTLDEIKGS